MQRSGASKGERAEGDTRFKMQFGDGWVAEFGARLRESSVQQLRPNRVLPYVPLRQFQTVILRSGATPNQ